MKVQDLEKLKTSSPNIEATDIETIYSMAQIKALKHFFILFCSYKKHRHHPRTIRVKPQS